MNFFSADLSKEKILIHSLVDFGNVPGNCWCICLHPPKNQHGYHRYPKMMGLGTLVTLKIKHVNVCVLQNASTFLQVPLGMFR